MTHFPDHPSAIVGLSNILLDISSEKLLPPPAVPGLSLAGGSAHLSAASSSVISIDPVDRSKVDPRSPLPSEPLGLGSTSKGKKQEAERNPFSQPEPLIKSNPDLPPPYKATSMPIVDRLAARDRAYGLLSGLTKLGTAWNYSEAWFALARAHEESGQSDKAKDVLWWCVELEEAMGVREWICAGTGGYVL